MAVPPPPGVSAHRSLLLPVARKSPTIHATSDALHSPVGKILQDPQKIPLHIQLRLKSEALPSLLSSLVLHRMCQRGPGRGAARTLRCTAPCPRAGDWLVQGPNAAASPCKPWVLCVFRVQFPPTACVPLAGSPFLLPALTFLLVRKRQHFHSLLILSL